MNSYFTTPFTGRKVLLGFVGAFGVIISVNLVLAFQAVSTFPGLEVKNSYVASQNFDADKAAQLALGWDVGAAVQNGELQLTILDQNANPVFADITSAIFGRATSVRDDQVPAFVFDGSIYRAPVVTSAGNWNLRLSVTASDGTIFRQRVVVLVDGKG
jgi:nitrogen fixation protein FixH